MHRTYRLGPFMVSNVSWNYHLCSIALSSSFSDCSSSSLSSENKVPLLYSVLSFVHWFATEFLSLLKRHMGGMLGECTGFRACQSRGRSQEVKEEQLWRRGKRVREVRVESMEDIAVESAGWRNMRMTPNLPERCIGTSKATMSCKCKSGENVRM